MKKELIFQSVFCTIYLLLFHFFVFQKNLNDAGLSFHIIDVGQGDGIFVSMNARPLILIDGGGDYTADPYMLDNTGIKCHLPLLVLTHLHNDHYLGFRRLLERCTFDILRFNDVVLDGRAFPVFVKNSYENKVKKTFDGEQFLINGVFIKIFLAFDSAYEIPKNLNNSSVVVFIKHGDFEGLFLGDLEADGQARLDIKKIKKLVSGRLDVLKIAHHGAINGYYPALIHALKPRFCVISVGKDNKFRHPSEEVLQGLKNSGCEVIRTDEAGSVVINSRGML